MQRERNSSSSSVPSDEQDEKSFYPRELSDHSSSSGNSDMHSDDVISDAQRRGMRDFEELMTQQLGAIHDEAETPGSSLNRHWPDATRVSGIQNLYHSFLHTAFHGGKFNEGVFLASVHELRDETVDSHTAMTLRALVAMC